MGPLPASAGCGCRVCVPGEVTSEYFQAVLDNVLQHGWHVTLVSAGDGPYEPVFAYTVGLGHRADHPELLMSGLDAGLMHRALNAVGRRVLAGERFVPGDLVEDVIGRVPVLVEALTERALEETVLSSAWLHRRTTPAVQLVWPDVHGVFGWQPGGSDLSVERQPEQWRVAVPRTGAIAPEPTSPFPVPAETLAFSCVHVVDQADVVRYVAREPDPKRGEDWTVTCGAEHPNGTEEMRLLHLSHLVRAAPSLRRLDLALGECAYRPEVGQAWQVEPL